jgi:hypothetical protein
MRKRQTLLHAGLSCWPVAQRAPTAFARALRRRYWAPYIDFMRYAWHALMTNEFESRPDVLIDGQPVLEFYSVDDSKWASIGYEFLFFVGFFATAWLVRMLP